MVFTDGMDGVLMGDTVVFGQCDCGAVYEVGSRFDHDADSGQCWPCSGRSPESMSMLEWIDYLDGVS